MAKKVLVLSPSDEVLLKTDLESPNFTGTPTAPTPDSDDNSTQVATTAFVQTKLTTALGDIESALHTINTGSTT